MNTESIRKSYRPDRIRFLMVGESPPAGGRFFYVKGAMTTYTARAFERAHGVRFRDNREFLGYFKEKGCFLDDLSHEPVDHLPWREREEKLRAGVGGLARRIREANPGAVVIALKKIEPHTREAVSRSGRRPDVFVLPFPGHGHQSRYVNGLCEIIRTHVPV